MKKAEPTSKVAQEKWEALAKGLAPKGVELSVMFGMPALKLNGKAFGGLFGNSVVLKLDGDAHAKALEFKGAVLFDPSGMGRPMKQWVVLPATHHQIWPEFALAAITSLVASAKPKPAKKKG